jgi:Leucine-rich repeat (LRR) protein
LFVDPSVQASKLSEDVRWWEAAALTSIDLSNNPELTALDGDGWNSLDELTHLRADSCALTHVAAAALRPSLKVLSLSNNRLDRLDDAAIAAMSLVSLVLSNNSLRACPSSLCASLERLHLQHNRLTSLPPSLGGLTSLKELDLSYNALESLPEWVGALESLQTFRCRGNRVSRGGFAACSSLKEIDMRENRLVQLPSLPPSVDTALFGRNAITSVSPSVFGPGGEAAQLAADEQDDPLAATECAVRASMPFPSAAITVLDLSENQLEALPEFLWLAAPNLATLDLRSNSLRALPPLIGFLPKVARVPLSGNPLRAVKRSFIDGDGSAGPLARWLKTRVLEPQAAVLEEWSTRAARFSVRDALESHDRVDARHALRVRKAAKHAVGGLRGEGEEGGALPSQPQWTDVVAESAPGVKTIRDMTVSSLGDTDGIAWPTALRDASASGTLLVPPWTVSRIPGPSLPALLFHPDVVLPALANLHTIRIQSRALSDEGVLPLSGIPDVCPALHTLDLQGNLLTSFPPWIGALSMLHSLDISHNRLTTEAIDAPLFEGGDAPKSLTDLDLSSNRLTALPAMLGACPRLSRVNLSRNHIRLGHIEDAAFLLDLPLVQELDLSENKLSSLPLIVAALPRLSTLYLANNDLRSIPVELGLNPSIKSLRVEGNPQRAVPPSTISQGGQAVLSLLRSRVSDSGRAEWGRLYDDAAARAASIGREIEAEQRTLKEREHTLKSSAEEARFAARPGDRAWFSDEPSSVPVPAPPRVRGSGLASIRGEVSSSTSRELVSSALVSQMEELEAKLAGGGLSKPQQWAAKKQLASLRAQTLRAQRAGATTTTSK